MRELPLKFARRYGLLSFALVAALAALAFQLGGMRTAADWILGVASLIAAMMLLKDMWEDLRTGSYGIDILAAAAIVTSVALRQYWAAMIVVLMLSGGQSLEDYAEHRASRELDALLSRAPRRAHLFKTRNKVVDVPVAQVGPGDRILIKPGEVVPVDATVIEGMASVDESSLTGESMPQPKAAGDLLLSGSVNLDGAITARANLSAADSQYEQIVKLVRAASRSQAPFVRLAERYSIPFTVVSFAIAGAVWIISGQPIRFLEVIIVATPCPLLLAAPIAIISGMSRASRQGIIIKTGSSLERLAQVRTMAFDKTGTLTMGRPALSRITTFHGFSQTDVLAYAAALESTSNHVLAAAVVTAAVQRKVKMPKARHVTEVAGQGLVAAIAGKPILVGRYGLLQEHGVAMPDRFDPASIDQTATYVAVDGTLAGIITLLDPLRPESKATLARLRRLGVKHFVMITGDNLPTARSIAKQLGISRVHADVLPAGKLHALDAIREHPVAFVGDGVNDAPVLTAADIGIALGARGSTAASESADVVILQDDLSRVADSLETAKRSFAIARQSILIGIGISVGLMAIFATGRFQPIYGAVVQEMVDVVVIFNALRAHLPAKR